MPNAEEYLEAARHVRRLAEGIGTAGAAGPAPDPARIAGSPLRGRIELGLAIVHDELARSRSELERLATVCERRAAVCTSYVDDLLRHRRLVGSLGAAISPPDPPAWWVEA